MTIPTDPLHPERQGIVRMIPEAAAFAAKAHEGQTRKYLNRHRPYIVHPGRVAARVSMLPNASDELVAAAWLHDTMEDCPGLTLDALYQFGMPVTRLVQELTNTSKMTHPDASRAVRKQLDRDRIATISTDAQIIKACDRIDNLLDMRGAPSDFAAIYAQESSSLLVVLTPTLAVHAPSLLNEFDEAIQFARSLTKIPKDIDRRTLNNDGFRTSADARRWAGLALGDIYTDRDMLSAPVIVAFELVLRGRVKRTVPYTDAEYESMEDLDEDALEKHLHEHPNREVWLYADGHEEPCEPAE